MTLKLIGPTSSLGDVIQYKLHSNEIKKYCRIIYFLESIWLNYEAFQKDIT